MGVHVLGKMEDATPRAGWTCQRQTDGQKCRQKNPPRARKCVACGKPRPPKRKPAHMQALELPYEHYVEINGGEFCFICGAPPSNGRRLHRDHEHVGDGRPRGLLCW